jgi:hypothetical protein
MGKLITSYSLHLLLNKYIRRTHESKVDAVIVKKLFDGKLSALLDFYLQRNESNDDLDALKEIISNVQGKTPDSVYYYLDTIVNRNNYFMPFLNSQSSSKDVLKAVSKINDPMTLERWNEMSRGFVIPMKELCSVDTYANSLKQIKKLLEKRMIYSAGSMPDSRREELKNCDIATYTKHAYSELWGYDFETVSMLYDLNGELKLLCSKSADEHRRKNFEVAIRYTEVFIKKSIIITDDDKRLLNLMRESPYSFGNAAIALNIINELSPAGDKIMKAKADYMRKNQKKGTGAAESRISLKRTIVKILVITIVLITMLFLVPIGIFIALVLHYVL